MVQIYGNFRYCYQNNRGFLKNLNKSLPQSRKESVRNNRSRERKQHFDFYRILTIFIRFFAVSSLRGAASDEAIQEFWNLDCFATLAMTPAGLFVFMPGLYIHIPFCAQKCAYCDFHSGSLMPGYLDALEREMRFRCGRNADGGFDDKGCCSPETIGTAPPSLQKTKQSGRNADGGLSGDPIISGKIDTIYIGGGTPTLLSPAQLQLLLDRAAELWDCTGLKEVTVEANPEDLTDEYIARLADHSAAARHPSKGVERPRLSFNRLSIGVQSFDDGLLRLMNRRHSAQRARDAVRKAQEAGFGNITVDLIYGIPGMTGAQWERSLDEAAGLGVQHVSAYHLTIEPGTPFGKMGLAAIPEAESEHQYETLRRKLGDAGFEHYEISNFARPGFRAVHNSAYWSGEPYLGLGPSAHSYDGRTRSWAASDTAAYIKGAGTDAIYESETLSENERLNEFVMTSLRRSEGIGTAEMELRFGRPALKKLTVQAAGFVKSGKMKEAGGRLFIPPENFLLSDYIISTLFV